MIFESKPQVPRFVLIPMMGLGLLFIKLAKPTMHANESSWSAFYLGVMILTVAVIAFVFGDQLTIEAIFEENRLKIESKNLLRTKSRSVHFVAVDSISVYKLNRKKMFKASLIEYAYYPVYYLGINLKNGEFIRTGKWSENQHEILTLAEELAETIRCKVVMEQPKLTDGMRLFIATSLTLVFYATYYRLAVGPLSKAMFFGKTPALILVSLFVSLLFVTKKLKHL